MQHLIDDLEKTTVHVNEHFGWAQGLVQRFTAAFEETKQKLQEVTSDLGRSLSLGLAAKLNSEDLPQKLQDANLVNRVTMSAHLKQVWPCQHSRLHDPHAQPPSPTCSLLLSSPSQTYPPQWYVSRSLSHACCCASAADNMLHARTPRHVPTCIHALLCFALHAPCCRYSLCASLSAGILWGVSSASVNRPVCPGPCPSANWPWCGAGGGQLPEAVRESRGRGAQAGVAAAGLGGGRYPKSPG